MIELSPLADRLRPQSLAEFYGQAHLLGEGKPLPVMLATGQAHSMIFWGPPGTGKTTLAHLIAGLIDVQCIKFSAILAGVKAIREAAETAQRYRQEQGKGTLLFVDEVHRFNKAQQDAFLPYVERGDFILVGATTENPSFSLNNALLSRVHVYPLNPLDIDTLVAIIQRAITDTTHGVGQYPWQFSVELQQRLAHSADGDARRLLNCLEVITTFADPQTGDIVVDEALLTKVLHGAGHRRFDKRGDIFYEQISALHKSVRGSAPDAALYWLARMLDGGCDPLYIARRVVRMASEDIGNADPRGLQVALNAWETQERLGSPEGELSIAQAIVYLASVPKSNAVYVAFARAKQDAKALGSLAVPMHLRNAPTQLMNEMGYGKDYRYAHDEAGAYAAGEHYFPEEMETRCYYEPLEQGLEQKIKARLARLRQLDQATSK